MKPGQKCKALLLSVLLALLPLAGCGDNPEDASSAPDGGVAAMGRYVEEEWRLPIESGYVHGAHMRLDGRIAMLLMEERGWEVDYRYYSTSDGADWREDPPAWYDDIIAYADYINSIHFNSSGVGVVAYYGAAPGSEEGLYRAALVSEEGGVQYTEIGRHDPAPAWMTEEAATTQDAGDSPEGSGEESAAETAEGDAPVAEAGSAVAVNQEPGASGEDGEDAALSEESDTETDSSWFYIEKALMGDDGMVYVLSFGDLLCYDPETGVKRMEIATDILSFTLAGGQIASMLTSYSAKELGIATDGYTLFYQDMAAAGETRHLAADLLRVTNGVAMAADGEGAVYLTDATGLYRVAAGGESWERLIDGALCSLSMPSMNAYELFPHGENEFLAVYSAGAKQSLINYVYSADTPTLPDTELTVYSMVNNSTVAQAMGTFRQKYPNVLVNIRTARDDGDNVASNGDDARKALNTELLAGKGPDLFLLADLPVDSYIEKGVLADLSDIVQPLIDSGELLKAVAETYKRDGKIHAVPARFTIPTVWGAKEAVAAASSLSSLADYAEKNPGKRLIGDMTPQHLLRHFGLVQLPELLDQDGKVNEETLASLFTDLKRIVDSAGDPHAWAMFGREEEQKEIAEYTDAPFEMAPEDGYALAYNKAELMPQELNSFQSVMYPNGAAYVQSGGKVYDESGEGDWISSFPDDEVKEHMRLMPGSGEGNVFTPACVIGVNAASDKQELALEFVKAMLDETTQAADLDDGFPIRKSAIESNIHRTESWYMSSGWNTNEAGDEELMIEFTWASKATLQAVADTFEQLTTPINKGYSLAMQYGMQEMMQGAFEKFCDGELSAEEAASYVAEETWLMGAEG